MNGMQEMNGHANRRGTKTGIVLGLLAVTLLFGGFGCKGVSKEVQQATKPFTIKYWRVYDDIDAFGQVINTYRQLHPHINVEYKKFRYDEYRDELLSALAEDEGPDAFSIQNTWMHEWQKRLEPVPPVLSVPFVELQGTIKKEAVTVIRSVPGMSLRQLANDYLDVVGQDVVLLTEQADPRAPLVPRIYGLPLSVDTMVLYYNRDLLNAAGIPEPAQYWTDFQDHVKELARLDEVGTIIQSGAALGTADNVDRAPDVLSTLMMQNGAVMTDDDGIATFDRQPPEFAGAGLSPGVGALVFFTDFANPEKEVYTWNDKMPNSLNAFINGQTAYFFGYSYHLPTIRLSNPDLNFGTTTFPQIQGNDPVYPANYWVEVVSNKTEHRDEVWDFVQFITRAENAQKYLNVTKKPTALRSLINDQLEDIDLSVFASQLPNARSWYRGSDADAMEEAFSEMIRQAHIDDADPAKILELGATKVNQTVE